MEARYFRETSFDGQLLMVLGMIPILLGVALGLAFGSVPGFGVAERLAIAAAFALPGIGFMVLGKVKNGRRRTVHFSPGVIEVKLPSGPRRFELGRAQIELHAPKMTPGQFGAAAGLGLVTGTVVGAANMSWTVILKGPTGRVQLLLDEFERPRDILAAFQALIPPAAPPTTGPSSAAPAP